MEIWWVPAGMDGTEGKECLCCCVVKCVSVLQCFRGITSGSELWILVFSMWQMQTPFQLDLFLHPQQQCLGHGSGGWAHQEWWGGIERSDPALWLEQRELLDVCKDERHLCQPSGSFSTLNWLAKVRLNILCWLIKPLWMGSKPNLWTVSISEFQFVTAFTLSCRYRAHKALI